MAVLVKPNGLLGIGYLAVIRPVRHLIVYPLLVGYHLYKAYPSRCWQVKLPVFFRDFFLVDRLWRR